MSHRKQLVLYVVRHETWSILPKSKTLIQRRLLLCSPSPLSLLRLLTSTKPPYDMTVFLDLPSEIRLIIYNYVLPGEAFWRSAAVRGGPTFHNPQRGGSVPARILAVARVNRVMRHEALPVVLSRINFHLMLFGQYLHYSLAWLRLFCLPHMDMIRSLSIAYGEGLNYPNINFVLNTISKLPNVSLRLSLDLDVMAVADSTSHMAFKHVHGFTKATVSGLMEWEMTDCRRHSPRTQETAERGANLDQCFTNAIARMISPCPNKACRVHPGRSRDKATSNIELIWIWMSGQELYCMACICDKFFSSWQPGPKSIFTCEVPEGTTVGHGAMGTSQR